MTASALRGNDNLRRCIVCQLCLAIDKRKVARSVAVAGLTAGYLSYDTTLSMFLGRAAAES